MLKYQKGYIFNGLTFVVNKEDVHNAKDEMFVEATALLPMVWPPTNADRIRAMSDKELAGFLKCDTGAGERCFKDCDDCYFEKLAWLQRPAEEV